MGIGLKMLECLNSWIDDWLQGDRVKQTRNKDEQRNKETLSTLCSSLFHCSSETSTLLSWETAQVPHLQAQTSTRFICSPKPSKSHQEPHGFHMVDIKSHGLDMFRCSTWTFKIVIVFISDPYGILVLFDSWFTVYNRNLTWRVMRIASGSQWGFGKVYLSRDFHSGFTSTSCFFRFNFVSYLVYIYLDR